MMILTTGQAVYGLWLNGVVDTNSLSVENTYESALDNFRDSVVSNASMNSVLIGPGLIRASQVNGGPPILNLPGGIIGGGFTGVTTPIPFRGSNVSLIGPGAYVPRGSTFGIGVSNMGVGTIIPGGIRSVRGSTVSLAKGPTITNAPVLTALKYPPTTTVIRTNL